jgi:hypothetical protein
MGKYTKNHHHHSSRVREKEKIKSIFQLKYLIFLFLIFSSLPLPTTDYCILFFGNLLLEHSHFYREGK